MHENYIKGVNGTSTPLTFVFRWSEIYFSFSISLRQPFVAVIIPDAASGTYIYIHHR